MRTREVLMSILHAAQCRGYDLAKFLEQLRDILAIVPGADIFVTPPRSYAIDEAAA